MGFSPWLLTTILLIIPIVHFYWFYKYAEAFSKYVKKDENTILWFVLGVVFWPVLLIIAQSELNKIATE